MTRSVSRIRAQKRERKRDRRRMRRSIDLDSQRRAGRIVDDALTLAGVMLLTGDDRLTTGEIDAALEHLVLAEGGVPSNKGYRGNGPYPYPSATCISPNEVVVHGIPGDRKLVLGDVVTVDLGVTVDGMHADAARTWAVGDVMSREDLELIDVCRGALDRAMSVLRPGVRVGEISHAIQSHVEGNGLSVVREFTGHGIGRRYHDEPSIPNYLRASAGPEIREGQVLAIEPIVVAGSPEIRVLEDGWTVITVDGSRSAQFEHTVLVTDDGNEVLT